MNLAADADALMQGARIESRPQPFVCQSPDCSWIGLDASWTERKVISAPDDEPPCSPSFQQIPICPACGSNVESLVNAPEPVIAQASTVPPPVFCRVRVEKDLVDGLDTAIGMMRTNHRLRRLQGVNVEAQIQKLESLQAQLRANHAIAECL